MQSLRVPSSEGRRDHQRDVPVSELQFFDVLLPQGHRLLLLFRLLPSTLAHRCPFYQVLQRRQVLFGQGSPEGSQGEEDRNVRSSLFNCQR